MSLHPEEEPAREFRESDAAPWSALTALVLGGSGFIGYHVVVSLLRRRVRVRVLVRPGRAAPNLAGLPVETIPGDLDDPPSLARALEGCDLLFHCAAPYPRRHFHGAEQIAHAHRQTESFLRIAREKVPPELLQLPRGRLRLQEVEQAAGAVLTVLMQPERAEELRLLVRSPELLDSALAGRLNASLHPPLFETASLPGLKRIVYVSSVTTIGRPRGRRGPRADSWANETDRSARLHASSPYFRMKEEMESMVTRAAVEGVPIVIGNPTFCVDTHDVLPTSGRLLCAVARGGMRFYLPGDLNVVATRDVAEALVHAAAWGRTGCRYILGGENLAARDFLALAAREAGVAPPRIPLPLALAEGIAWMAEIVNAVAPRSWPLLPISGVQMIRLSQPFDCRLAHEELGMPRTPIAQAVREALRWFREHGYL